MAFQSGPSSLQWYDSSSLLFSTPVPWLSHCLHLTIVYIFPPPVPNLSFLANSFPWLCLAVHTEPDCTMFPELIGVISAWQETQRYYGNARSITGQRINTLSVIFDFHFCVGLMVAMHGCYLLRGILSASPGGTLQYAWGQLRNCWIVGLPWMRAFPLQMKNLKVNFASQLSVERDNGFILFNFNVQTSHSLNCIPVLTLSSRYLI